MEDNSITHTISRAIISLEATEISCFESDMILVQCTHHSRPWPLEHLQKVNIKITLRHIERRENNNNKLILSTFLIVIRLHLSDSLCLSFLQLVTGYQGSKTQILVN